MLLYVYGIPKPGMAIPDRLGQVQVRLTRLLVNKGRLVIHT